jgi:hypothetical protein
MTTRAPLVAIDALWSGNEGRLFSGSPVVSDSEGNWRVARADGWLLNGQHLSNPLSRHDARDLVVVTDFADIAEGDMVWLAGPTWRRALRQLRSAVSLRFADLQWDARVNGAFAAHTGSRRALMEYTAEVSHVVGDYFEHALIDAGRARPPTRWAREVLRGLPMADSARRDYFDALWYLHTRNATLYDRLLSQLKHQGLSVDEFEQSLRRRIHVLQGPELAKAQREIERLRHELDNYMQLLAQQFEHLRARRDPPTNVLDDLASQGSVNVVDELEARRERRMGA